MGVRIGEVDGRSIPFPADSRRVYRAALSIEGERFGLELLGDLYTLPISGGDARRITEGMAFDSQPRFSPDGGRIAFLSDRDGAENVWIADPDGSNPKKLSGDTTAEFASPAWTPDGRYVIASRSGWGLGTFELWMYHVKGGSGVQVTQAKAAPQIPMPMRHNALGAVASPDERFLYYAQRTGGFGYNATFPMWQVARRDRVTGDEDVLTQNIGSAIRPLLSPDGTRLVYGTRHDARTGLRIRDLKTGEDRWLKFPVQRDDQESRFTRDLLPGYAFMPDGDEIVVTVGGRIHRVDVDDGRSREIPFVAEVSQQLGPELNFPEMVEQGPVRARLIQSPVWSPDGERIVALRSSSYERINLAMEAGHPPGMDLVWIPADGGGANLVIPARGAGRPHFTTEPDRIYLHLAAPMMAPPTAPSGLVSVRFDGTDRRKHLKVTGAGGAFSEDPVPADDIRISPDGDWALALVANQLYLIAIPAVGGEPPTVNIAAPTVPLTKLTEIGADYFGWSADGETITWAVGATFYMQPLDTVDFATPKKQVAAMAGSETDPGKKDSGAQESPACETIEVVVEVPRAIPQGTIVLRGARAITMRGDEVIEDADVVVRDNRIVAVGPAGTVEIPEGGAVVRDVGGMTLVPGFVDTHAHWTEIRRGVLDVENWSFLANVAYGVTTGLDVQTFTNDLFAYQDLVDAGEIIGPRAFSTGPGIFSNNNFQTLDEVRGVLTRYKEHYRTRNLKAYIVGNRKQRQLVAEVSRELEMMPTTEGGLDLKLDLTHAIDGFAGTEHALPIVPLYKDVVELVARSKIGYTPTLLVTYGGPWAENHFYATTDVHDDPKLRRFTPHSVVDSKSLRVPWFHKQEHAFPRVAEQAAKIVRAGGRVGIGAHGQLQGLGYHWEMWALASGGLQPIEVLRVATILGAEIIGYAQDLGSIEPGKLADIVVLAQNPLDDIHNTNTVKYVMKNGELFDGDTLEKLWPERQEPPQLWFWDDDPAESPAAARSQ
jgi:hypothetical protein